jgi:4-amino-4-deoxy-L-arabinose transferase-like glycosyltransferase
MAASQMQSPRAPPRLAVATILGVATFSLLLLTARDIGLTWDEPIYMVASESYVSWFDQLVAAPGDALSDQGIAASWDINHEHPPIDKVWSGLLWQASRGVLDDITAHRLGNMLLAASLGTLLFFVISGEHGQLSGVAAVVALFSMPRMFFHAHLATLDLAAATATFAVCCLFWRTRHASGWSNVVWTGVAYGLASGTKVNALLEIPIILLVWALICDRRWSIFKRIAAIVALGLPLSVGLWPWLYDDTPRRVQSYLEFMITAHYPIEQWYLHRLYDPPPWHYAFVLTLAVVPLTTTLLAGVALVAGARHTHRLAWLLLVGAIVPKLLLLGGRSQIYDGERLWMPAFPFIAALAGIGFGLVIQVIRGAAGRFRLPRMAAPLIGLAGGVALAPQLVAAHEVYPHLLSYYSESIGGLAGASRLGLETTYWADTYADVLDYLNAQAPTGSMIWAEAHDVLLYYQAEGLLRPDLRIASRHGAEGVVPGVQGYTAAVADADYVVVEYRQSGFIGELTDRMRDRTPLVRVMSGDTPLLEIYGR